MVDHIGSGEIGFDANDVPEYVKSIRSPMSVEAEANFECDIDAKTFKKLTGIDLAHGPDITGMYSPSSSARSSSS